MTTAVRTATGQAGTVKAAGDVALTGANNKANGALLFCAEGANNELEAAGSGADDIATCQNDFKAADHMAKMAAQNGKDPTLSRDEGMLNDAAALAALEKFEKNFGVSKDDYVNRMLASHGNSAEFAEMLSSKLTGDKIDKLLASAAETRPAETEMPAIAEADKSSGVGKPKTETSLRDSLRAKLAASDANRKLASKEVKTDYRSITPPKETLQPHGLESLVNSADEQQEESLTIFDVVHQKLQNLRQRERI